MSNYSDQITATGSLITFDAPSGGIFDSLSVPITPTQDLHGYDHPWPGGGWKNKLNPLATYKGVGYNPAVGNTLNPVAADKSWQDAGNDTFTISNLGSWSQACLISDPLPLGKAYVKISNVRGAVKGGVYICNGNFKVNRISYLRNPVPEGGTIEVNTTFTNDDTYFVVYLAGSGADVSIQYPYAYSGDTAETDSFSPYSNICPISGLTGLSAYVGPTNQQAQATEYAISFGTTVYSGSVNLITGEVKSRPVYASYNGEALVGPWLSSMDEYAVGVTPTTGAQVVDIGGALATSSITPVDIPMREGSNNVWVDTSAVITLVYRLLQVDRQTGATSIGKNAESLLVSKQFGAYSKVVINVTSELSYESGNDTGRTLTVDCPWGTQAMADNILASLQGYQYQPYEAQNAILDPAAELGDGLTVNGVYGGIFKLTIRSGALHTSDVSAPQDEEIDHEYSFTPASERKIERRLNNMQSELSVQADQISAKVDRDGGDPSSVSWHMDADAFKVQADGNDVLIVDDNGLTVNGNGTFTGSVQAKNIKSGGSNGTFHGGGITGGSINTSRLTSGINTSLGNADYSADVFSGAVTANYLKGRRVEVMGGQSFYVYGKQVVWATINYKNHAGANSTVKALIQGGVNP